MAIFIALFFVSQSAQAGFFSFLGDLLKINNNVKDATILNSQNIPLLQASINSNPSNGKTGGDITINGNALVPDSGPMGTIADISETKPNPDQISLYVVRENDNLAQIAKMFDVSVNTIRWANDLKPGETIKTGQVLVILPVTGIQYTIKKGDTIKGIAKRFSADADEILQFNDMAVNEKLVVGDEIIIPSEDYTEPEQSAGQSPLGGAQKPKISVPYYAGYYLRPIDGGRKSQGIHGHNAVDLAVSCGTLIVASADGNVIISRDSGWNAGYGNYIVVSHLNGTQTLYAHLKQTDVIAGWHVKQGQIIGLVGTTGHSTGCHVHFEIRGAKNPF